MTAQVKTEAIEVIEELMRAGKTAKAGKIVFEIMSRHPAPAVEPDWWVGNAYEAVRATVGQVIREMKIKQLQQPDPQLTFPGWAHLQLSYLVERDGESTIVPVEQLTDKEIDAKIAQMETMVAGLRGHINELIRYKEIRKQAAE